MKHDTDADSGEAPDAVDRLLGRRTRVPPLPAPRPHPSPAALGPPSPTMREEAERTPVAEVTASPRRFYVTVEIPGASQDTIQIAATPSVLRIHAPLRGGAAYRIEVALPARVDPESVKVTYRNGVLDVAMSRSARRGGEGRER